MLLLLIYQLLLAGNATFLPDGGALDPFQAAQARWLTITNLHDAPWVAIGKARRLVDEPTGLGGDYITFEILRVLRGPKASVVGIGGHGWRSHVEVGDLFLLTLTRESKLLDKPFPPSWHPVDKLDAAVSGMKRINNVEEGMALFNQHLPAQ
jgi:hypothetical protein